MSGKWKGIMIPDLMSLIITIGILILIESCGPLCQELFKRVIETAIAKQTHRPSHSFYFLDIQEKEA